MTQQTLFPAEPSPLHGMLTKSVSSTSAPVLEIQRRPDGHWITGLPDDVYSAAGPYTTKAEAESDRRGLVRFYKNEDKRSFFTSTPNVRS